MQLASLCQDLKILTEYLLGTRFVVEAGIWKGRHGVAFFFIKG